MPRMKRFSADEKDWYGFLHQLPCLVTGQFGVEAAHVRMTRMMVFGKDISGVGAKPDFPWCVPLCPDKHRAQHSTSEYNFWRSHGFDPDSPGRSILTACIVLGWFYQQGQVEQAIAWIERRAAL